ncbi:MAG: cation-translocating P-type ATPase, partial [Verrucomicrobia bacterium]|nr:cation-translocating P-type ATPase [Verrucomicrobiota bacterium]
GTLTVGRPQVVEVVAFEGDDRGLLALAAAAESHSEHPLAQVIVAEARRRGVAPGKAEKFEAVPGMGTVAVVARDSVAGIPPRSGGLQIAVGNRQLMQQRGAAIPAEAEARIVRLEEAGHTVVLVAIGSRRREEADSGSVNERDDRLLTSAATVIGAVAVSDTPREEARETVAALRSQGIEPVVMLTGDHERVGQAIAGRLGIGEVGAGLLPADKVGRIRALQQRGLATLMCGDGINDAPSLAAADVGVAMHGLGTDITIEAADVVLMHDDLRKIPFAIEFCRRVVRTVNQNIWWFAIIFNGTAVFAASQAWIGPIGAAITHQIASLLVVCNSLRLLWT